MSLKASRSDDFRVWSFKKRWLVRLSLRRQKTVWSAACSQEDGLLLFIGVHFIGREVHVKLETFLVGSPTILALLHDEWLMDQADMKQQNSLNACSYFNF